MVNIGYHSAKFQGQIHRFFYSITSTQELIRRKILREDDE